MNSDIGKLEGNEVAGIKRQTREEYVPGWIEAVNASLQEVLCESSFLNGDITNVNIDDTDYGELFTL